MDQREKCNERRKKREEKIHEAIENHVAFRIEYARDKGPLEYRTNLQWRPLRNVYAY